MGRLERGVEHGDDGALALSALLLVPVEQSRSNCALTPRQER
jgi:hypothetical protein